MLPMTLGMSAPIPRGKRIGAVSMWLLLLLSEKPMYGYEIIRELEKRFSGFWKPKTGTIYPALEKLEKEGLLTSTIEFREGGPDRKHYALTEKGKTELSESMQYMTKTMEMLERYREMHQAIFRHKGKFTKNDVAAILKKIGESLDRGSIDIPKILSVEGDVLIAPTEPLSLRFLYAKENHKLEIHMEIEWIP